MNVEARFLTEPQIVSDCGRWTSGHHERSSRLINETSLAKYIESEHSPIRALILLVDVYGILGTTSVHFVRHKVGVEHFVTSNRPDRTGKERSITDLVNHRMLLNFQALRAMARERLCSNAAKDTQATMVAIKEAVVSSTLTLYGTLMAATIERSLVPKCVYRGNVCHEFRCCGRCHSAFEGGVL